MTMFLHKKKKRHGEMDRAIVHELCEIKQLLLLIIELWSSGHQGVPVSIIHRGTATVNQ